MHDILKANLKAISWVNKVDLPPMAFEYERRLDLFSDEAWATAKKIAAAFPSEDARKHIGVCHATYQDGSEQDFWVHIGIHNEATLFIEVSHSYIDQHFLSFHLWNTDENRESTYPTDLLFLSDYYMEKPIDSPKIGQLFVKPVGIFIHASKFDPSKQLLPEDQLTNLTQQVQNFPIFKFWKAFQDCKYEQAAKMAKLHLEILSLAKLDGQIPHLRSAYALCEYLSKEYRLAAESFILAGKEYSQLGFNRNSDCCFFFALEAGKKISDMNLAFIVAKQVVDELPFITENYKSEILSILKSYYSGADYIGSVVLARRVIELILRDRLEAKFGKPIKAQIKEAKNRQEIPKNVGPGLYSILELAKVRENISLDEYKIGSSIKDFGNKIHDKEGVQNVVDAKYALQSCLHFLHRV